MCPCEDVMVLSEGVLHVPGLFWCQEGTDIRKVSTFFRNLDCLQGICCRGIFGCIFLAGPCFSCYLCSHVRPKMTLKGDKSCTTENCTLRVTGPAWTGSTMSPKEIRPGFSRPVRLCPMWLTTDACTRLIELPGSTRMRLTSKSPISRDRMRASRCGCNIRVGVVILGSISTSAFRPNNGGTCMSLLCDHVPCGRHIFYYDLFWMDPFRGLGHLKSDMPWIIGRSFSYDMERGVRGGLSWRLGPSTLSIGRPWLIRNFALLSRHLWMLSATKTSWVAARRQLRALSICSHVETSRFVILHFMFCKVFVIRLCRVEHKYCPTKASDRSLKLSTELGGVAGPIVCGEFWHEESPWGLVMNDMRAERRGEHVVQPFADGANGWLVWEVVATGGLGLLGSLESELSSWGARCMGVCGSCGLTLHVSGMAPAVPGYIDSRSGLEFATWPLER
ncbi:hypothetical protein AAG906_020313 [Vitis piasezkii]